VLAADATVLIVTLRQDHGLLECLQAPW